MIAYDLEVFIMKRKNKENHPQNVEQNDSLEEQNKDQIAQTDNVDQYYKEWEDDRV